MYVHCKGPFLYTLLFVHVLSLGVGHEKLQCACPEVYKECHIFCKVKFTGYGILLVIFSISTSFASVSPLLLHTFKVCPPILNAASEALNLPNFFQNFNLCNEDCCLIGTYRYTH